MVPPTGHHKGHLPSMGNSPYRSVCYPQQQEMPSVLLPGRPQPRVSHRHVPVVMDKSLVLCIPSYPAHSEGSDEDQAGLSAGHSPRPSMAQATLVHPARRPFGGDPATASSPPRPDLPRPWLPAPSEPKLSSSDGLETLWLNPEEQACSEQAHRVLLGCRKPSTRATYLARWKLFSSWSSQQGILPTQSSLQLILEYLLLLKPGLSLSSVQGSPSSHFSLSSQGQQPIHFFHSRWLSIFSKAWRWLAPRLENPFLSEI